MDNCWFYSFPNHLHCFLLWWDVNYNSVSLSLKPRYVHAMRVSTIPELHCTPRSLMERHMRQISRGIINIKNVSEAEEYTRKEASLDFSPAYRNNAATKLKARPTSPVLTLVPSVAPDFGAAVLLVCAGPVELLELLAPLLLAVVDILVLVIVSLELLVETEVTSVVLFSEEVSVVIAVGSVVVVLPAETTAVTAEAEVVSVEDEDPPMTAVVVVEGVAEGRIVGAPVVVVVALVLAGAPVMELVVLMMDAVVEVVWRPFGTGTGTKVDSVAAELVDAEAMEAPAAERELADEEMTDAAEAEEEAMAAESVDAETVAKGMITGDRVTEPVDTDALAGMMTEVVYPLIAIGRTGPDGTGCWIELGIPLATEVT